MPNPEELEFEDGLDRMRAACARKLQEALGLSEAPDILSVEGFGFVAISGFGAPQQEVYEQSSPQQLAAFHMHLLRRVRQVVLNAAAAGVEDGRGLPVPGNNRLSDPHLLSMKMLVALEQASGAELRAAYQRITGKRVRPPRDRQRPVTSFTPKPGSITLQTALGFLV